MADLTHERLKEVLDYDAETGIFRWKVACSNRSPVGSFAGANHGQGYRQIRVDGRIYMAHRLAWFISHGEWPSEDIDHRNGVRSDNRLSNLRDVSRSTNLQNMRRPHRQSLSGLLGAHWRGSSNRAKKWESQITVGDKRIRLGYFTTPEEAHAAYVTAKRKYHVGCLL